MDPIAEEEPEQMLPGESPIWGTKRIDVNTSKRKTHSYSDKYLTKPSVLTFANVGFELEGESKGEREREKRPADNYIFSPPPGAAYNLLNVYRKINNYDSGIVVLQTELPSYSDYVPGTESILVMDLKNFLMSVGDPLKLADRLEAEAAVLAAAWNKNNGSVDMYGCRSPVQFAYTLSEHTWKRGGRSNTTVFELLLSSYGHTRGCNHYAGEVSMAPSDLKTVFKMRTTSGFEAGQSSNCQVPGFRHDAHSYNVPLAHFLGFLRDPELRPFLRDAWANIDDYNNTSSTANNDESNLSVTR